MLYAHKRHLVSVERLTEEVTLYTVDSFELGHPGEYLITDQFGNKTIITAEMKKMFWEPVEKVNVEEEMKNGYEAVRDIYLEEANAGNYTYTEGWFTDKPL